MKVSCTWSKPSDPDYSHRLHDLGSPWCCEAPTYLFMNPYVVQQILHELGATDLDAVDEDGQTVLIAASQNGDIDSVKVLHEIKADLNLCGEGGTAMHHAAFGDQTEVLKVPQLPRVCMPLTVGCHLQWHAMVVIIPKFVSTYRRREAFVLVSRFRFWMS